MYPWLDKPEAQHQSGVVDKFFPLECTGSRSPGKIGEPSMTGKIGEEEPSGSMAELFSVSPAPVETPPPHGQVQGSLLIGNSPPP